MSTPVYVQYHQRRRRAPGGSGAFNPANYGTVLGWWRAEEVAGLSDGDPIGGTTTLTDFAGVFGSLTQATAGARPTKRTVNGKAVVRFDGVDDYLVSSAISASSITGTSIFAVVNIRTPTSLGVIATWPFNNTVSAPYNMIQLRLASTTQYEFWGSGYPNHSAAIAAVSAGFDVVAGISDQTNDRIYVADTLADTQPSNNLTSVTTQPLFVGADGVFAPPQRFLDYDLRELLVYRTVVSGGDRSTIDAYMATQAP